MRAILTMVLMVALYMPGPSLAARKLAQEVGTSPDTAPTTAIYPTPSAELLSSQAASTVPPPLASTMTAAPARRPRRRGALLRDPTPHLEGAGNDAKPLFESITKTLSGGHAVLVPQGPTGMTTEPAHVNAAQVLPNNAAAAAAAEAVSPVQDLLGATSGATGEDAVLGNATDVGSDASGVTVQSVQRSPCVCSVFNIGSCTKYLYDYFINFRIENRCRHAIQVAIYGWRYQPSCKNWANDGIVCPLGSVLKAPIPPPQGCKGSPLGWCSAATEGWWMIGGATASSDLYGKCAGSTTGTEAFATKYDTVYYYAQSQQKVNGQYITWSGSYTQNPGGYVTKSYKYVRVPLGNSLDIATFVQPLTCTGW